MQQLLDVLAVNTDHFMLGKVIICGSVFTLVILTYFSVLFVLFFCLVFLQYTSSMRAKYLATNQPRPDAGSVH